MEATASAKYLRGSAQKARLVVDLIRGKDVNQALAILRYTKKRAAGGVEKCMRSAIANANEAGDGAGKSAGVKPAKLAESKSRKRGGAAAAPRAKRTAPKAEAKTKKSETSDKPVAKKASKKKVKSED